MIPPLPWHRPIHHPGKGDRVVLLHGLWRSVHAMEDLARHLNKEGYETLNIPYPSFRKSLDEIVAGIRQEVGRSRKPTHFVTHSMGGIVLRCLAHKAPELITGKIVMLAPPNQGSEIIDWLQDSFLGRTLFGPGGMSLTTENVRQQVPGFQDQHQVAVVMGRSKKMPLFQSFLGSEHDGVVTIEGGKVTGMKQFEVINADHTFIMNHPEARKRVLAYLGHSS
ncbi:alpha/beta fold hydrolase [Verrucomicrobiaceae bacterium 227]